jgi:hypothetical protein
MTAPENRAFIQVNSLASDSAKLSKYTRADHRLARIQM